MGECDSIITAIDDLKMYRNHIRELLKNANGERRKRLEDELRKVEGRIEMLKTYLYMLKQEGEVEK
ncbi:MAG: hypothetical protein QW334_01560 [Thermofilum sp.]